MPMPNQYLWLGADGLLFRYSIGEDKFFIYGESDGAIPNEYLHKSTLVTRDGAHIYMGGVTGLLHIDRGNIQGVQFPLSFVGRVV